MITAIVRKCSLSAQVAEALRSFVLRECRPGDRLDSEAKLSKRFGVSVMTLREALAVLANEKFIERVHGSGTFVREPERLTRVALIMTWDRHSSRLSYFHMQVFQLVKDRLLDAGIQVQAFHDQLGDASRRQSAEAGYLRTNANAYVFISTNPPKTLLRKARERGAFVAGFGSSFNRHLIYNPEEMLRQAVEYFRSRGRKEIAVIGWRELFVTAPGDEVAKRVFKEAGLTFRSEWFQDRGEPVSGDAGWLQFNAIWSAYPRRKPDGILLMDDILCSQASRAILNESIAVPDDLMVVSHSNKGSGMFLPFPTTRLEFDPDELAKTIAAETLSRLAGKDPSEILEKYSPKLKLIEPETAA
jgi:DNA-binding LacI/PurR family transcriptional regulator